MADQDAKDSHEKTVNLETHWRWNKNKLFQCANEHTCEWQRLNSGNSTGMQGP